MLVRSIVLNCLQFLSFSFSENPKQTPRIADNNENFVDDQTESNGEVDLEVKKTLELAEASPKITVKVKKVYQTLFMLLLKNLLRKSTHIFYT